MKSDIWFDDHEQDYDQLEPIHACLKAELKWLAVADVMEYLDILQNLATEAKNITKICKNTHEGLDALIDDFYGKWTFSGTSQRIEESRLNSLSYALSYRTGSDLPLALILTHVLQKSDFNACIVVFETCLMVLVKMSEGEGYLIDPASGQQSWYLKAENLSEEENPDAFQVIPNDGLYKLFLAHQKWAFISENKNYQALNCIELLIDITGDDPYERRDRGYLLRNINCSEMAREDLEYFINECPDDPAIELIQHQLEELEHNINTIH
ncbi:tetratricopeptide repeat protein [Pseudoalteromonas denitrificans]|uniref:Regulator of sirC expression, contains transglutaminase-like and TPR domains n=1 Tax=Pseudoalteromonas denitrificans DSM 6059 TaxID=1123010 RepID=A0A1I1TC43_9GAMM|nr:tetratricopeptide repeat protein [Pseudoalteromonas denitrificans]SFD56145.1 Regulator of sirC expression, contains transglutaminase-like and TPR domains [Pseudoalteromonas denitrificans DSM 6059]